MIDPRLAVAMRLKIETIDTRLVGRVSPNSAPPSRKRLYAVYKLYDGESISSLRGKDGAAQSGLAVCKLNIQVWSEGGYETCGAIAHKIKGTRNSPRLDGFAGPLPFPAFEHYAAGNIYVSPIKYIDGEEYQEFGPNDQETGWFCADSDYTIYYVEK